MAQIKLCYFSRTDGDIIHTYTVDKDSSLQELQMNHKLRNFLRALGYHDTSIDRYLLDEEV